MMNLENHNFIPDNNNNLIQFPDPNQTESANSATHPANNRHVAKHIYAVDSRQRDYKYFPDANNYSIPIPDIYRNVTAIELKAAMLPRTEYNVHSSNKTIDFSIGDYINNVKFKNVRFYNKNQPLTTGTYSLNIEEPYYHWGTKAEIDVNVDSNGRVQQPINIINAGSGYSFSNPPRITLLNNSSEFIIPLIGEQFSAKLREGQYTIGGNPELRDSTTSTDIQSWTPFKLINEVECAMSHAILNDSEYCYSRRPYTSYPTGTSIGDINDYPLLFSVRAMSQYPNINSYQNIRNLPENYETNSCLFNRLYFSNMLIFKTDNEPSSNILTDTNGYSYEILKQTMIPNSNQYIIYCKLNDSLNKVSGNYWNGINNISVTDGTNDFNIEPAHFELLFATGDNQIINSASLLGFNKRNYFNPVKIDSIKNSNNSIIVPESPTYTTDNDWYLYGDPEYVALSFKSPNATSSFSEANERVDSENNSNISGVFSCLIFDSVNPAVLQDLSSGPQLSSFGSMSINNNDTMKSFINTDSNFNEVKLLSGNIGNQNTNALRHPGILKALRGADFDEKKIEFVQPIATLSTIDIRFTKFSKDERGTKDELYQFNGKEHLLIFEISCNDVKTGNKY